MNILMIGGTGFIGFQLILRLLNVSGHNLYLLARSPEKAHHLLSRLEAHHRQRIHILHGDITQPGLGLSPIQAAELQGRIGVVIHMAACLRFEERARAQLFATNVEGTRHVLDFASGIRAGQLHYISTAYTVGTREHGVEELYPLDGRFNNPYEESKVAAEQLVFSYRSRMSVCIYRPSIVIGDSRTGEADSSFSFYGLLLTLEAFRNRAARTGDDGSQSYRIAASPNEKLNVVPVDYVCDVIESGLRCGTNGTIYHITHPSPPAIGSMLELAFSHVGFPNPEYVSPEQIPEWTKEERQLAKLTAVFSPYLTQKTCFDDGNTLHLLRQNGLKPLQLDFRAVESIIGRYSGLRKAASPDPSEMLIQH
ncbi:SDR family oxidoreductase [Paenibacillus mucilaginosus]|nr:SDR family oxidoreductase [Paenibacillus mucilaginosus]MCG7216050.1 SDR family oxidoreductase [Paenibacillus mucilaginosus]WDM24579.1 SDR family oxidoreductase [Paenibacillus mucilaginosus]